MVIVVIVVIVVRSALVIENLAHCVGKMCIWRKYLDEGPPNMKADDQLTGTNCFTPTDSSVFSLLIEHC